jgi:hypothetical protein
VTASRHVPKVTGVPEYDALNQAQRVAVAARLAAEDEAAYRERVRSQSVTVGALAPDALLTELQGSPLGQKFLAEDA